MDFFGIIAPDVDAWDSSMRDLPYDFFFGMPVRLIVYRRAASSVILPIVLLEITTDRARALTDAVSPYGFPGPVMVAAPGVDPSASSRSFSKR